MSDAAVVLQPLAGVQGAPALKRELGLSDLTLFAICCITSARWVPFAAHAGAGSISLWVLATLFFVVPLTVAVAALVAKYPSAGGLYIWTREDFGPWNGFLCFWVYWMGIAFLFPTAALLYMKVGFSLLGSTGAQIGDNRIYLLAGTLALIWVGMGSNLFGLKVGKWTENIGALATWAVGALLIAVASAVWMRQGTATPFHIIPRWSWGTVSLWAAIAYATTGMEAPGMMVGEMHDPERTMRRAGWIAAAFATLFYASATAALLVVLPPEKISELNGFAEVGNFAGTLLGMAWISPVIALLVFASGLGFVGGIGTATSRLPLAAAIDGHLPKAFTLIHPRWGTPWVSTITLGLAATFLLILYQLGDTMRAAFDELVSMMVITGFIPYFFIFGSAWKAGQRLSAVSGGAIIVLVLLCSVVPPAEITNVWLFETKIIAGTLLVMAAGRAVYRRGKRISPSADRFDR
jgi:amino acid transporter